MSNPVIYLYKPLINSVEYILKNIENDRNLKEQYIRISFLNGRIKKIIEYVNTRSEKIVDPHSRKLTLTYNINCGHIIIQDMETLFSKLNVLNYFITQYDTIIIQTHKECEKYLKNIYELPYPWIIFIDFYCIISDHLGGRSIYNLKNFFLNNITDFSHIKNDIDVYDFIPIKYLWNGLSDNFIYCLSIICNTFYNTGRKGILFISNTETFTYFYQLINKQSYIKLCKLYEYEEYDTLLDIKNIQKNNYSWLQVDKDEKWRDITVVQSDTLDYPIENVCFLYPSEHVDSYKPQNLEELCSILYSCKLYIEKDRLSKSIADALYIEYICTDKNNSNENNVLCRSSFDNPINDIPIYIIHYKKLVERKKYLVNILTKLGFTNIKWFDYIDRDTLSINHLSNYIYNEQIWENKCNSKPRKLTLPEIACFNTHIDIQKYIIDNKIEKALVLEDDCIIEKNFKYIFQHIINQLPVDFDLCHISDYDGWSVDNYKTKIPRSQPDKYVYELRYTKTVDAYILSNKGACILYKNCIPFHIPVDYTYQDIYEKENMNIYWSEPTITQQGSFFEYTSSITPSYNPRYK